jgi:hypothetical protein
VQPTGRVPWESFGKAIDSTVLTYNDLSGNPTDGSFFLLTIPLNHKKTPTNFFIELSPAIDFVNGLDVANQNYFAILNDSLFFDLQGSGVDISKVRGYFTLYNNDVTGNHVDTSVVNILVDPNQNGFYGNYWMAAELTNNPTPPDAVNDIPLAGNALGQNYPNAFNASTEIDYSLANAGEVSLKVYNTLGQEIATIANDFETAGDHQITFHGENLPSGTYFYTLKSGDFSATKRMVLAK